ncbi:hypothetical protein BV898_15694 [Hypsibius exemplaris]|uniref:Uncharacterized protein n=1 Tax=Hypsibius exemplaris TaxID=2072580 RepID=A0A9X6RKP8_HYPEX|nr:hypothetical protein BV898_15694 [Hypsibius exemplaris]
MASKVEELMEKLGLLNEIRDVLGTNSTSETCLIDAVVRVAHQEADLKRAKEMIDLKAAVDEKRLALLVEACAPFDDSSNVDVVSATIDQWPEETIGDGRTAAEECAVLEDLLESRGFRPELEQLPMDNLRNEVDDLNEQLIKATAELESVYHGLPASLPLAKEALKQLQESQDRL